MLRRVIRAALLLGLVLGLPHHRVSAVEPSAPQVNYVTPGLGDGAGQTFRFVFSDSDGATDIVTTEGLIANGSDVIGVGACYFFANGDRFWLRDDQHTTWMGPVTAGSLAVLTNSQCTLSAAGSSIALGGTTATMAVTVTFSQAFTGPKAVFMKATDRSGLTSDWIRGGAWTASPVMPQAQVLTSRCPDGVPETDQTLQLFNDGNGQSRQRFIPRCFPAYTFWQKQEGAFTDDLRPLPVMGRTCGRFNVLVAYVDTPANRRKLLDNTFIPPAIKDTIAAGRVVEGLTALFASYSKTAIMGRPETTSAVDFGFTVAISRLDRHQIEWGDDGGLGFAGYDAVMMLDDLTPSAGHGVHRWPSLPSSMFYATAGTGVVFNIDPFWLSPGLVGNELLRRNLPTVLAEYRFGEQTLVTFNGTVYDVTPMINPRTGENLTPTIESRFSPNVLPTAIYYFMNGWEDVDHDGVEDCIDPGITPTPDNVDGDFLPDRLDPDLSKKHVPATWLYAPRGGFKSGTRLLFRP